MRVKSRQNLTWGAGLRWSHGNDIQVVSGLTFTPASRTDSLFTGFVQDEIALVKHKLSLTVGTKLLHTNFSSFEAEPSGRLMWTPTEKTSVWAAYTHAVRTPSDAEHDFFLSGFIATTPTGIPFFARFNANRDFRPEQLNGYELGFRQLIVKSLYVDVSGFFNHYHDLFSEDITGAPFLETNPAPTHFLLPARFGNGLLGQTKGIEVAPEWRPTTWWRLRGAYSFLHMNIEKSPNSLDIGTAPQIMGSSPEHQVSVESSFDMTKRLSFDLGYRYVSALPGQLVPAYSTGDARLGWTFHPGLELSLVGRNLLQPSHPEFGTDPGLPAGAITLVGIKRAGFIKLTWTR
jgi:iron complex outermembrane recepter protein